MQGSPFRMEIDGCALKQASGLLSVTLRAGALDNGTVYLRAVAQQPKYVTIRKTEKYRANFTPNLS